MAIVSGYIGLIFVTLHCLSGHAICHTIQDVKDLQQYIFVNSTYHANIRPVEDQDKVLTIIAGFRPFSLNELDEVHESLKMTAVLVLNWKDEGLKWDPYDFGGLQNLYLPQNKVWKPDFALKNSLTGYKTLGDDALSVMITWDGRVSWMPVEVFLSSCDIDITYFPFDVQSCSLKFVAWTYTTEDVVIDTTFGGINLQDYSNNSLWDIVDAVAYSFNVSAAESEVVFEFKFRRKPGYYMLTLVFPVLLLYTLNIFVFVIPCDSGEKSGFAITVVLAFTVFLTILETSFPKNSNTNPYFSIFVSAGTIQSAVITVTTLVQIRCALFDENTKVPACLIAFVRFIKCKSLREKLMSNKVVAVEKNPETEGRDNGSRGPEASLEGERSPYTWKYCIDSLDGIFFCVFATTLLISVMFYFIKIKSHDNGPTTTDGSIFV